MAIPQFATYINPLIAALKKLGGFARADEVCSKVAEDLKLPDKVLEERLKNGVSRFENQVHWARFYLFKTGYIDSSKRGVWGLTEKGRNAPAFSEDELRKMLLEVQMQGPRGDVQPKTKQELKERSRELEEEPPPDTKRQNYREKLLAIFKSLHPIGFERLCQRLLREAGFEQVIVTGKSGDGGIDGNGVLQINPFVSFRVLFQCKRYEGNVGPSQVRDFRGAMMGRAEKGIILTTGSFTTEAKREAIRDGVPPIELVDGEKILDMFEHLELGLIQSKTFEVNESFFDDFRK